MRIARGGEGPAVKVFDARLAAGRNIALASSLFPKTRDPLPRRGPDRRQTACRVSLDSLARSFVNKFRATRKTKTRETTENGRSAARSIVAS